MRSIGFLGADMRLVLWTEVIILGIISMIIGFILSSIASFTVSFLSFEWFPGFEIFLKKDTHFPIYQAQTNFYQAAFLILILMALVAVPSYRVTNRNLPGLLNGDTL
jgi:ABC-type antimicrobial peptide transport system permease subunit